MYTLYNITIVSYPFEGDNIYNLSEGEPISSLIPPRNLVSPSSGIAPSLMPAGNFPSIESLQFRRRRWEKHGVKSVTTQTQLNAGVEYVTIRFLPTEWISRYVTLRAAILAAQRPVPAAIA